MPTIGSVTKTIRINPKDLEVIEGLMNDGTSWSGAIHKLCEGSEGKVIEKIVEKPVGSGISASEREALNEIESSCVFFGVTEEVFLRAVQEALTSGLMGFDGEKIVIYTDTDATMQRFKEACHEKNVDVNKMLEKATQMVWNG